MTTLTFNNRYFQLTKSFAIKNWQDGLIEILTNSADAYSRLQSSPDIDSSNIKKPISIGLSNNRKRITVLDNGIGMNSENAIYNLLNVGAANTDSSQTRGYFNRGAKDVTALGTVSFTCLKENDWCKIVIYPDLAANIIQKKDILPETITNIFGLSTHGVLVELDLLDIHAIPTSVTLSSVGSMISNLFQIRSIMSSPSYMFTLNEDDTTIDIKYTYKKSTLIDKIVYRVPGYEEIEATFQLFMTDSEIPDLLDRRVQQNGILLRSSKSDFDITFFDESLKYNKFSKYFYGFLTTEGISIMLRDFETNGPSNSNSQLILNPSRGNVNVDHPFIRQLYSIPKLRLKTVIDIRETESYNKNSSGRKTDIDNMVISNIENVANNIIRSEIPNYFVHNQRVKQIAVAFKDIRDNYANMNLQKGMDVTDPNTKGDQNLEGGYKISESDIQIEELYTNEIENKDSLSNALYGDLKENDGSDALDRYVYAQLDSSVKIKIDFMKFDDPTDQYKVITGNFVIYIKINLTNPVIQNTFVYDDVNDTVEGVETPIGKTVLLDIVSDVIAWLHIEENSKDNVQRDYSILDGILHGKNLYNSKRNDIKLEMLKGL